MKKTAQSRTEENAYDIALSRITKARDKMEETRFLNLSNLGLSSLPSEIGNLNLLEQLDLSGNHLDSLPESIQHLSNLRILKLGTDSKSAGNKFTELPSEIFSLSNLEQLEASYNKITEVTHQICNLKKLKSLSLHKNSITQISAEISELRSLNKLYIGQNQLSHIPYGIFQLVKLTQLYIFDNQLEEIPPEIASLRSLRILNVSGNRIKELDETIGSISSLIELHIGSNNIISLPKQIGKLKKLRTLTAPDNKLSKLPASIGDLPSLKFLDLTKNQLVELPDRISNLTLNKLLLHENPTLGLSDELLGPSYDISRILGSPPKNPKEILAAYFRIAGKAGELLGECKIIVVGRGGVGKTSLVKRLEGISYDPKEPETHGINRKSLNFRGEKGPVLGRLWDFGGQVVLHSMHEFFLTARTLYVLVLGERDDMLERDATYWLQLIRSYAGTAPVIVVMNKSGGRERNFDRHTLAADHGPILGWVPTECSESSDQKAGIDDLRETIIAALDSDHMESVRRKFPRKWSLIKSDIEQMSASFMEYEDFQNICQNHGEIDPEEQSALASDLHDLGIALNYARDPRLRNTTVLRPDWLANGIYAVLRANDRDKNVLPPALNRDLAPNGRITLDSLKDIHIKASYWRMLDPADYPPEKQAFLLRLMSLFNLSYPLDGEEMAHLVPTLLSPTPPEGTDEPNANSSIRIRYEFKVVPAPLLPWFISRVFSLIPERLHWSRGTMISYGEAIGKIWVTQDERFVYATVSGLEQDRDRLLSIARGALNKIFSDYKSLDPGEQWEYNGRWVPTETLVEFGVLPPSILPTQRYKSDFIPTSDEEGVDE